MVIEDESVRVFWNRSLKCTLSMHFFSSLAVGSVSDDCDCCSDGCDFFVSFGLAGLVVSVFEFFAFPGDPWCLPFAFDLK